MTDPFAGGLDLGSLLENGLAESRRDELLSQRGEAVAQSEVAQGVVARLELLAFRVGGECMAVEPRFVREVLGGAALSSLPGAPRHVIGIVLAEDRAVPVLDLRVLLGLQGGGMSDLKAVLRVEVEGEAFALAAEVLDGLVAVPSDAPVPLTQQPFKWSVANMAVLDLGALSTLAAAA